MIYRPSASHTWQHCALSLQAPEDTRSKAAADLGTAAHALLDRCHLLGTLPHSHIGEVTYKGITVTEEMADAVQYVIDYVNSYVAAAKGNIEELSEQRVDPVRILKGVVSAQEAAGTADRVLKTVSARTGTLIDITVIDFKHGLMFVPLEHENEEDHVLSRFNPQLMQYLLAAVSESPQTPHTMHIVIIQPRATGDEGPVREIEVTREDLEEYRKNLIKRLKSIQKDPVQAKAGQIGRAHV